MESNVELAQWAPGISLAWAVISLAVGGLILVVIVVRLWRDQRRLKQNEEDESSG